MSDSSGYTIWFTGLSGTGQSTIAEIVGPELEKLLGSLEKRGFEIGGDRLKTTPRGYDADHPRIELLRHKSLVAGHMLGFEPVIHTPDVLDLVRADWQALRPLVEWIAGHCTT